MNDLKNRSNNERERRGLEEFLVRLSTHEIFADRGRVYCPETNAQHKIEIKESDYETQTLRCPFCYQELDTPDKN